MPTYANTCSTVMAILLLTAVAPQSRNRLNGDWHPVPMSVLHSQRYGSTTVSNRDRYYRHDRLSAANVSVARSSTDYYTSGGDGDVRTMTELTTVGYPIITTTRLRPHYRRRDGVGPKITRLFVKPSVPMVGKLDIEKKIVPASLYSSGNRGTDASVKRYSRITGAANAPPRQYQLHKNNLHKPPKKGNRLDMMKIGIAMLVKIGLIKLKLFGFLKILFFVLLKFKLLLILVLFKYLLFCKAIDRFHKHTMSIANWVLLPLALVPLIMLLALLPLLLLPLLLPLLLFLPVPVARYPAAGNGVAGEVRQPPHLFKIVDNGGPVMQAMMHLLESKECVERIACQLATKKESKLFYPIVNWCFGKLKDVLKNRPMSTYMEAFIESTKTYNGNYTDIDGQKWCSKKYSCPVVSYDALEMRHAAKNVSSSYRY